MYSWNPVFNFYKTVKSAFIENFGSKFLYKYDKNNDNCLSYWTRNLAAKSAKYSYMADMISPLIIKEYRCDLLIRYGIMSNILDNTGEDFFEKYDGFYMETRTVVIDIINDKLIAAPFRKFRNLNECGSYSYENVKERIKRAKCIEVTDKMDGSMAVARWYLGELCMYSSGGIDRKTNEHVDTFYKWAESHSNIVDMLKAYEDYTFIFEAIFPESDPHIVFYPKEKEGLYLLGMRNIYTGEELSYRTAFKIADGFNCPHTEIFNIDFEEAVNTIKENGMKKSGKEGYVISIDGFKVKLKFEDYLFIHSAFGDRISSKTVLDAIRGNYLDDLIASCPKSQKQLLESIVSRIISYINIHKEKSAFYWEEVCRNIPGLNEKELALWIKENVPKEYRAGVFALKNNKTIDWLYGRTMLMIDSFLSSVD